MAKNATYTLMAQAAELFFMFKMFVQYVLLQIHENSPLLCKQNQACKSHVK